MKKNSILWAVLPMMAAALMTTACSNDDSVAEAPAQQGGVPAQQGGVKTIPYTVTVNGGAAQTRATVESDNQTLYFADGDKLYVTGTDIQGVLDIQAGDGTTTGPGTANATFSGDLTYSGEGSPADDLALTATLVSAQQTVGNQVSVDAAGAVTVNYPTTAFCSTVNDAVQQYSDLKGTSNYGEKSFTLYQQTAFLNFTVKLICQVSEGYEVIATVENDGMTLSAASVTTTTDADRNVVACFVLPVAKGTELSGAKVTIDNLPIGTLPTVGFGGDAAKTLEGKVYNVARSIVDLVCSPDFYDAQNGDYITYSGEGVFVCIVTVAEGATVTLGGAKIIAHDFGQSAIHCLGDANIVLADGTTNTVEAYNHAGIFVPEYSTLTISGAGSLIATGGDGAPGIGSGHHTVNGGNISITGGTVIATGGSNAAGIGGGYQSVCGNITIGSDVTQVIATKGDWDCDPIGAGKESSCGTVTIDGETITEDGVTIWTAGNATTHYLWDVSNNYKTWTLTKKEP